jgi:phosphoglycerol transferase MdoB-like AlkP superfamily enzyme
MLICLSDATRLAAVGAVDIRYDQYNNYIYNGFTVATLLNMADSSVKAPLDYNAATVSRLREAIRGATPPRTTGAPPKQPHIIALQMEAYAAPSYIDPRIGYAEDPFGPLAPYAEGIRHFHTLVSVYGGGTANTEYEFLTGNNLVFYPFGVMPFIRYMNSPKPSLATDLAALGYQSIAMHPHTGSFYNRATAYARLGFDRLVTQDEFDDPVRVGYYISDGSFGRKVIELFEEERDNGPLFLFGISIQNHGPYNDPMLHRSFPLRVADGVALNDAQRMEMETYGANIRDASAMLASLLRYFSAVDDPVLVLVFGDHQAAWSWVRDTQEGAALDMRRYSSEGFFWANYPLEDGTRPTVSASGLGPEMLLRAGLPLSLYQKGVELQFREIMAYNIAVMVDNDGGVGYVEPKRLEPFWLLQYDRMFGSNYMEQGE